MGGDKAIRLALGNFCGHKKGLMPNGGGRDGENITVKLG